MVARMALLLACVTSLARHCAGLERSAPEPLALTSSASCSNLLPLAARRGRHLDCGSGLSPSSCVLTHGHLDHVRPLHKDPAGQALLLRGGGSLCDMFKPKVVNIANAFYYGSFGLTLAIDYATFFGPKGCLPYITTDVMDPVGKFFSRSVGVIYISLFLTYLVQPDSTLLTTQFGIVSLCLLPLFVMNVMDKDGYFSKPMCVTLIAVHSLLTIWTLEGVRRTRPEGWLHSSAATAGKEAVKTASKKLAEMKKA